MDVQTDAYTGSYFLQNLLVKGIYVHLNFLHTGLQLWPDVRLWNCEDESWPKSYQLNDEWIFKMEEQPLLMLNVVLIIHYQHIISYPHFTTVLKHMFHFLLGILLLQEGFLERIILCGVFLGS
jgi:hypothetical protein